jgi:hypothetical protein
LGELLTVGSGAVFDFSPEAPCDLEGILKKFDN